MRRLSVLFFLLLAIFCSAPTGATAQAGGSERSSDQRDGGFTLGQNYPNPFNPDTRIPFRLTEGLFVDGTSVVVSVRIYNMLQQFVAAPIALDHPFGGGDGPMIDVAYTGAGNYEAYWDGRDQTGREVASGIYFVQMTVNGRTQVKRIMVSK